MMPMGNTLKLEDLLKPDCVPDESAGGENWRILHGDTLKLVKGFQPGIFDAVITDPPYASGGTKQNERNRTTNQKYSSMKAENALPDFDPANRAEPNANNIHILFSLHYPGKCFRNSYIRFSKMIALILFQVTIDPMLYEPPISHPDTVSNL